MYPISQSAIDPLALIAAASRTAFEAPFGMAVAWLVLRGQADVRAQEGDFALRRGDWIVLHRESASLLVADVGSLVLGVAIASGAGPERMLPIPGRGRMPPAARLRALRTWRTHGAFNVPGRGWMKPAANACTDVLGLLSWLQEELVAGAGRCPGHSDQRKRQVLLRMQRARLYLEGQAGNGVRIADLARRINFSPWYFSKVFHALYGIGPLQFAVRARLDQASRLLATTRLPVTEVSASCGFDNPCSFARAFRAQFGMTASEHRLRHGCLS